MKVLFVVKSMTIETLGSMYLSAVVKHCGHEAKICELDDALIIIKIWKPDVVGLSIHTGDQNKFRYLAKEIKEYSEKIKIIVGGWHPTFFPQDFIEKDYIDYIAKGESENWIAEFLDCDVRYNIINDFPWPDRVDFPNHRIRDFITSRGCPYNCSYCYNERWANMFPEIPRIRTRDVKDVIAEIKSVKPEFVYFQDSCFGIDIKWFREFSDMYMRHLFIPYHCHMRPNQVTEERAILLQGSNCLSIRIALESASSRLRKLLNREKTDTNLVIRAMKYLRKRSISVMIQNMIGLPTGTIEDDLETLEFNIKCKPDYAWVSIFAPYPGTELGDWCKEECWYIGDYSDITDNFFDTSFLNFTDEYKEQLECLQKIFALCVEAQYMPKVEELTRQNFPKLVHKIMRAQGDKRLYG